MGTSVLLPLVLTALLGAQSGPEQPVKPVVTPAPNAAPEVDPTQMAIRRALPAAIRRVPHSQLVRRLYNARGGGPLFHEGLVPSPAAHTLLRLVAALDTHGIDRDAFRLGLAPDTPHTADKSAMARQKRMHRKPLRLDTAQSPRAAARTDARLANALVEYVLEFRFFEDAHPTNPPRNMARIRGRKGTEIVSIANQALENLAPALTALWPQTSDYARLMKGLARYRELASQGRRALPKVSYRAWKKAVRRGPASGKVVEQLQRRLAFEGYFSGDPSGLLDTETQAAVAAYNAANGLSRDDGVTWSTLHVMNKGVAQKVGQIRATLQRMRESVPLRAGLTTWAQINIPAFQLTLYLDGQLARSHRVIVGNNRLDFNRTEWKQGYLNRTPLLKTHVKKVVINPAWIPPRRILDADFHGAAHVIVPPGKNNPLGYVKFVLDRTNAVFMHDTNHRKLFQKPKRAYSHGCIRVHEALELAQWVLKHFAGIDKAQYEALAATGKKTPVPLTRELPVYVEYLTVGVDSADQLVFYPDVYGYDAAWLRGKRRAATVRYGSARLRPKKVPLISHADYQQLKGQPAPITWPVADAAPPAVIGETPDTGAMPTGPDNTPL